MKLIASIFLNVVVLESAVFPVEAQPLHKAERPLMPPPKYQPRITHRVYLDIEAEDDPNNELGGRIEIGLFGDLTPKTVENFRSLVTGEKGIGPVSDKHLHYVGSTFHRVVPNFMIQGGDFTHGDGRGGESIYGTRFDDEDMTTLQFDRPYYVAMSNSGPDTNGSQFFITTVKTRWLDGKHVIFGEVLHGTHVVGNIEDLGTVYGKPKQTITIIDCGELPLNSLDLQ